MNIFDGIEKLITEHGSAAVLSQQLAFAKDQFSYLERQVSDFQIKIGKLEAQLEREKLDRDELEKKFQRLSQEHEEEIRILMTMELKRGKRTGGKWIAFCPKCHMPLDENSNQGEPFAYCTANCGWGPTYLKSSLSSVLNSFSSSP